MVSIILLFIINLSWISKCRKKKTPQLNKCEEENELKQKYNYDEEKNNNTGNQSEEEIMSDSENKAENMSDTEHQEESSDANEEK